MNPSHDTDWPQDDDGSNYQGDDGTTGAGADPRERTLVQATHGVLAQLRAVQFATATTGNVQACLTFQIVDEGSPDKGRVIAYFGTFTDGSIDFTVDALRNCGWTGDNLAEVPQLAAEDKLAEVVSLKIDHEEYQGKVNAKVKFVNKPGTGGKAGLRLNDELTGGDLDRFASMMRTKVRAAGRDAEHAKGRGGASAAPSANRSRRPASPPPPRDDVPPAEPPPWVRGR